MMRGLKYALREQIFSFVKIVQQTYPFNKEFFRFFLDEAVNHAIKEQEFDDDDFSKIDQVKEELLQESYQLPLLYQQFYAGRIESLFKKECLSQASAEPLSEDELKRCLEWSRGDLPRLRATQETLDLFLYDLLMGITNEEC